MAARGTSSKENITKKIMEVFEGAFIASDGKTIRIPLNEDGEPIEIKVSLVAAKDLEGGGNTDIAEKDDNSDFPAPVTQQIATPTEEEKQKVQALLASLGM